LSKGANFGCLGYVGDYVCEGIIINFKQESLLNNQDSMESKANAFFVAQFGLGIPKINNLYLFKGCDVLILVAHFLINEVNAIFQVNDQ